MCHCSLAVPLRAYLESLANHTGTAVPAAYGALRALVGHVLLQVVCPYSLVAQVTMDLLEDTHLHVSLGGGGGGGGGAGSCVLMGCALVEGSHRCPSAFHSSCSPGQHGNTAPSTWRALCEMLCLDSTVAGGDRGCFQSHGEVT